MKWFLNETVQPQEPKIRHGNGVLLLGSCFSENIYNKGIAAGLNFKNSAFGTLFHPIAIARILKDALTLNPEERILERDGRFYSWDGYTKFNAASREDMLVAIQAERKQLHSTLAEATHLFITFGTAKGYVNQEELLVANCHKLPSSNFTIELSDVQEMKSLYALLFTEIKQLNPNINIVLTVSPVRHAKDGLVVNNRSKARLLQLCEELEQVENVSYFPAYEMIIDELRDYRFYAADLVHPTQDAVNYVWEKFQTAFFSEKTILLNKEVEKKRAYFNHIPMNDASEKDIALRAKKEEELGRFLRENPEIIWA